MFSNVGKTLRLMGLFVAITMCAGCKSSDPDGAKKEAAWESYVATMSTKGPIIETKLGEEMRIPNHSGYMYRGTFNSTSGDIIKLQEPEESIYYQGKKEVRHEFYGRNCRLLSIPHARPGSDPNAYYGDADGSYCFLGGVLHVTSVSKGAIWYIVDTDILRNADVVMALNHYVHYQTGTVVGIGGTLPALLRSEIHFSASFGKGMSASASGHTIQIGDATLVLQVKTNNGTYTIEVLGSDGGERQQSIVGLASAITNGTKVSFPIDLHVFKQSKLETVFSSSKIGRLDAEYIEVSD